MSNEAREKKRMQLILERISRNKENKIVELKDEIYLFQKQGNANKKEIARQERYQYEKKAS